MAKVKIKDKNSLKEAKEKLRGLVEFRKTKYGVVATRTKRSKKNRKGFKIFDCV
jgi:uncharacterized protein YlxP (DUF503 family)